MPKFNVATKDKTKSRIRGMLNTAKLEAMFEVLSDDCITQIVTVSMASHARAAESGRNLDEKKTLASLMPQELRDELMKRFSIDIATDAARITIGEEIFSRFMYYLQNHPERLTMEIYDTLIQHKTFQYIVSMVHKKQDAKGNFYLVPSTAATTHQVAVSSEFVINMQNILMAKMKMVIESISKKDLIGANLGSKSKAFRDLLAANHMLHLDMTPDAAMEATFKETTMSDDGKTVKEKVTRYVQRSAQTWASK